MGKLKQLWHKMGSPPWLYRYATPLMWGFGLLAVALIGVGGVWGLFYAPEDYLQGNSFRIIYVHVPTAILAENSYLLMGITGIVTLVWRMKMADIVLSATLPVGMALTAVALATGAIWGKPTWGAWWVWDARTASMLILLFLFFGIMALRAAIPRQESRARASALLAIVGMINIPIIKYSVDWWLTMHQSSTFTVTDKPTMPPEMYLPLIVMVLGFYCFFSAALLARIRVIILQRESETQWVRELVSARGEARG